MSATDIGKIRAENQDMVETAELAAGILAVVCDGMGGERAGREASGLAISAATAHFLDGYNAALSPPELRQLLLSAVTAANTAVFEKSHSDADRFGMGTTCVMAYADSQCLSIVNVGDSRAYLLSGEGTLEQLTLDHTATEMLYAQGRITREEMKTHPQRNMLTKAVGVERRVTPDFFQVSRPPTFRLLLCSDGLSGYCSDAEIAALLREKSVDEVCGALIALANEKGGRDNITVAVVADGVFDTN